MQEDSPLQGPLPHALLEPLHIFPVYLNWFIAAALVILAVVILGWLLAWFLSQKKAMDRLGTALPSGRRDAASAIRNIMDEYMARRAYREGCHKLSAYLRTFFEKRYRMPVEEMTAQEIIKALPRTGPGHLFQKIGTLQFGADEPREKEFKDVCNASVGAVNRETADATPDGVV